MLSKLIDTCLDNRWIVVLLLFLVAVSGVYVAVNLPIDAFPDLTNNQVVVITEAGPMSPTEVEQQITYPIESSLMGLPKMLEMRSISKLGLSLITVVLDDSVDIYFARQLVNERLREVRSRLPKGLEPVLGPVATAFGEIFQYTVDGAGTSLMERKTLQDWVIRPQLRTIPGVNEVNSWGGLSKQITVEADPAALLRYNLTLHDLFTRLEASNHNFGGGFIEHEAEQYTVMGMGRVKSPEELERVVLVARDGVPVLVRDVARVKLDSVPRQGAVVKDGTGETVCGMAIMLKGENSQAVIERVQKKLASIRLPKGVQIVPFYDQSDVINSTVATVRKNLLEAGLLVSAVLLLFLGNLRAALIVAMVIPVSMLFGFFGMAAFGISVNLMSLGAIDFGMIVDGAVVMMENAMRHVAKDNSENAVRNAAKEVARPILFGVAIIIAVYLPIFFLQDLEGRMFRPMAITVCASLLGSLLLALTIVPVLSQMLLKRDTHHFEPAWLDRLTGWYLKSLDFALAHRAITVLLAVTALGVSVGSLFFIGSEFMPKLDEGSLLIESRKLPGINVPYSASISTQIEKILLQFPEVKGVVTKLGRPDVATEAMGVNAGDIYVLFKPESRWVAGKEKEILIGRIAKKLEEVPGMSFNFTQPMAMRVDEAISGVKGDIAMKIFGEDSSTLEKLGERAMAALKQVQGVADLQMEVTSGVAELRVEPDRAALARYGLTIADVEECIDSATGGRPVSDFVEGQRRFPIVMRLPESYRKDLDKLRDLILKSPTGEQVRLRQVASLAVTRGPEIINREDGQRRIVVQCNVRGRDLGSFVDAAQAAVAQSVVLPPGYSIAWGGQFENQARATKRLAILLPASILVILGLLFATFHSLKQALLILLAVPFSLIGGIAALWLRGLNLNLSASVGFIALFGVAVLNGIVLVSMINQLRRTEQMPLKEAVRKGAGLRLRPVLMTALVASLGFIPMAFSTTPGSEIQRPLATVVVGGLISATVLTLYLLPIMYPFFAGKKEQHLES